MNHRPCRLLLRLCRDRTPPQANDGPPPTSAAPRPPPVV
ncbi:uncharacterized protein M6B38_193455 [Iris pallida]|uniref:Uncharacterized protein n=1 Tax=Iris pallida TaxID=29817 RepID=A0AAX6EEN6_IRIPA|nr:uncharacterized protein M6B38_193455 [Iris pallida]